MPTLRLLLPAIAVPIAAALSQSTPTGSYSPNQVGVEIYRTWKVGSQAEVGSAR